MLGVFEDTREYRPVVWTKQIEDKIVEGKIVHKDRDLYKGNLFPTTNLIQTVGVGTTVAYVTGVRPFFNAKNENNVSTEFQKNIVIVNNIERLALLQLRLYPLQEQYLLSQSQLVVEVMIVHQLLLFKILLVLEPLLVQKQLHLLQMVSSQV